MLSFRGTLSTQIPDIASILLQVMPIVRGWLSAVLNSTQIPDIASILLQVMPIVRGWLSAVLNSTQIPDIANTVSLI